MYLDKLSFGTVNFYAKQCKTMMALEYTELLRRFGSTLLPSLELNLPKFSPGQYEYFLFLQKSPKIKAWKSNISKSHIRITFMLSILICVK